MGKGVIGLCLSTMFEAGISDSSRNSSAVFFLRSSRGRSSTVAFQGLQVAGELADVLLDCADSSVGQSIWDREALELRQTLLLCAQGHHAI